MRIDPQRIVRLAVLIKQGSFGRAAAQLGLTQPALSQSIAQMEKEIGAKVVERTPQGVEPTIYGQVLYEHAIAIDRELAHAAAKIQDLASGRRAVLSVGTEVGGAASLVALAVAELQGSQHQFTFRIHEESSSVELIRRLRDREVDVVICHRLARVDLQGLRSVPLFRGRRMACVRSGHPLADDGSIQDLVRYPFVCPPDELGHLFGFPQIFSAFGREMPEVLVSNSIYVAKEIVLASDAFALFSDVSVVGELRAGRLRAIEIGLPTRYLMQLVMRDEPRDTEPMSGFVTTLSRICSDFDLDRPGHRSAAPPPEPDEGVDVSRRTH